MAVIKSLTDCGVPFRAARLESSALGEDLSLLGLSGVADSVAVYAALAIIHWRPT